MTSQINPNNINGAYPVAGQDNNSQGFRDNFTNTVTNFTYAAQEITALQNNAVLKAPLSSGTTVNNDLNGTILSNAQVQDLSFTVNPLGTASGPVTVNYQSGHYQTVTTNGPITLGFTNFPTSGIAGVVSVAITVTSVAHTVTFPATANFNNVGIQGLNPSTNTITFAVPGIYVFEFVTISNGYAITVNEVNQALTPFNNSSEDISAGGACNLGVTTEYFNATTVSTATLGNGANGQIKTFIMTGHSANMLITVSSAGWKSGGNGTITFTAVGAGCTLQFLNGAWFCIGNNGAEFS